MAKKVSKNQRTDRGRGIEAKKMAKVVMAVKKDNGQYSFRNKVVELDMVQDELKAARG